MLVKALIKYEFIEINSCESSQSIYVKAYAKTNVNVLNPEADGYEEEFLLASVSERNLQTEGERIATEHSDDDQRWDFKGYTVCRILD